ncbi:MAG: hypothetical protein FWF28_11020 [Micrococcales bacterium]|nr:hypothetical protein [Micrococcales bacterium]
MAGSIFEFFGYRAEDVSREALAGGVSHQCPFLEETCEKTLSDGLVSGACSIKPVTSSPVICCPIRLYAGRYRILQVIADEAFGPGQHLVPGPEARIAALHEGGPVVAVFGQRWGGELRLPQKGGHGNYFVDWILAKLTADGSLEEFVAVEVQTMDTTGNYRNGRRALLGGDRRLVKTSVGINWENVSKRIIPQLVYKGQVLQRESLCRRGIFFGCPYPVFGRIIERLGGRDKLPTFPPQPASITFVAYDYAGQTFADGVAVPLDVVDRLGTTVYKLQDAFNTVTLPTEDVYQAAIEAALRAPEPSDVA